MRETKNYRFLNTMFTLYVIDKEYTKTFKFNPGGFDENDEGIG